MDNKRAKQLSPSIGLQLPQPPIVLDYNKTITDSEQHVNPQNEKYPPVGCAEWQGRFHDIFAVPRKYSKIPGRKSKSLL